MKAPAVSGDRGARGFPWRRFVKIVAVWTLLGPLCGTLVVWLPLTLMYVDIRSPDFFSGLLMTLAFGAPMIVLFGLPAASLAGLVFASRAILKGKSRAIDAMVAAAAADAIVCVVVWVYARDPANIPGFFLFILIPSLVAALLCRRMTRRWLY